MNFVERLDSLLKEKNLTKAALADAVDVRPSTISDWKRNGSIPPGDTLLKIAQFFGVTTDYLLTGEQVDSFLMPDETVLISNYRKLTNEHKMLLQNTAQALTGVAK